MLSSPSVDVLDPGSPGVDAALLCSLAARRGGCRALVLGGRREAALVSNHGVEVLGHVPMPGRFPWLAGSAVRRALAGLDVDRVATWSEAAAVAAIRAGVPPSRLEASVVAVGGRVPWLEPWVRDRFQMRPVGFDLGPVLFRRGWRVGPRMPIKDLTLGFPSASPDAEPWPETGSLTVAIHLEPMSALDIYRTTRAIAAAAVAGRSVTLVMPGLGAVGRAERRWILEANRAFSGPDLRVVVDDRVHEPQRMGDRVDVLVGIPRPGRRADTSVLTLRQWLGQGVPIVTERTRDAESLVEDGVDGRLVTPGDRHAVTSIMVRLARDPALLAGMRHAAAARHGAAPAVAWQHAAIDQAGGSSSRNRDAASR